MTLVSETSSETAFFLFRRFAMWRAQAIYGAALFPAMGMAVWALWELWKNPFSWTAEGFASMVSITAVVASVLGAGVWSFIRSFGRHPSEW